MADRLDSRAAEDAAARFLERQGYKIAQRNFTTRLGEIDIVALDDGMVVFVEVKTAQSGLSARQRMLKRVIQEGRVEWMEIRMPTAG